MRAKKRYLSALGLILGLLLVSIALPPKALALERSTVDRPDQVSGYQIHTVYVSLKDSSDVAYDTNGQIDSWVKDAQNWLQAKVGKKFIFDTFGGQADTTFLKSKYNAAELCNTCGTLEKLTAEYLSQDPKIPGSKTLLFFIHDNLSPTSCGWAGLLDNRALVHNLGSTNCNSSQGPSLRGIGDTSRTLIHELIHTYGIGHPCLDTSDIMYSSTECTKSLAYLNTPTNIDTSRLSYMGTSKGFGVDLLQMPIWADGSGSSNYSQLNTNSGDKYLPKLSDGTIYAIAGVRTSNFSFTWDKNWANSLWQSICTLDSGGNVITGITTGYFCSFDIPSNWRAGTPFTFTQKWVSGPWNGTATASGKIVRKDYSLDPCTSSTCFVGGSTTAKIFCWGPEISELTLQRLSDGVWSNLETTKLIEGPRCPTGQFSRYPNIQLNFTEAGTFIYRWYRLGDKLFSEYSSTPFAVIVTKADEAEPSSDEISSAQSQAVDLGRQADEAAKAKAAAELKAKQEAEAAAKAAAEKEAAEKAAAELKAKQEAAAKAAIALKTKTTITCVKGKVVKKVTGINAKCPSGYVKK